MSEKDPMSHVFISYNQEDADFAGLLMMRLEKAGFATWMDKSRLRAGSDWSQEIDQGITDAFALVVIMSPSAKASEYVTYEWSFALGTGIPVLPVLRKQTDLHPRLNRIQYLNFKHDHPWEKLVDELSEIQTKGIAGLQIPKNTPPYIRHAIAALDSANKDDRQGGIDALTETDHPLAGEALLNCLDHPLRDVRFGAALVLGQRGERRAIPVLLNSLPREFTYIDVDTDPNSEPLPGLISAFNGLGLPGIEALIEAFNSDSPFRLQPLATMILGEVGAYKAVPDLARFLGNVKLDDTVPWLYRMVINALSQIGNDNATEAIISAWHKVASSDSLKDVYVYRFVQALTEAVVEMDSPQFIPVLTEALENPSPLVRGYALLAIERMIDSALSSMAFDELQELEGSDTIEDLASEGLISALADLLEDPEEVEVPSNFERPQDRSQNALNGREGLRTIAHDILRDINTPEAHLALMRL
jgi:HEAT repeat protein